MKDYRLTKQLLDLMEDINGEGGLNFIRIRNALEDIERLAPEEPNAQRFIAEFGRVCHFIHRIVEQ